VHGYRTRPQTKRRGQGSRHPTLKADRPLGEWNHTMITVKGQQVSVSLNGETVIKNATLNEMPAEGPSGLQHHGQAIEFANIWVRKD
jgi:hypothetical protein